MTRNDVIVLPNPHLREKSRRVHVVTDEVTGLIKDMEDAILDWEDHRPHEVGVALAAVQIDQLQRVVIVRNDFENKEDRSFFALINPEVIKAEGKILYDQEGCLSIKDIYGLVPRHSTVRIRALDTQGREIRLKARGFLARVLQHEIDHTHGKLFIDYIKDKDAFFQLTPEGELQKLPYEEISKSHILW